MGSLESVFDILPEPTWVSVSLSGNINFDSLLNQIGIEARVELGGNVLRVRMTKKDILKQLGKTAANDASYPKPSCWVQEMYWESKAKYDIRVLPAIKQANIHVYAFNDSDMVEKTVKALHEQGYDVVCKNVPL